MLAFHRVMPRRKPLFSGSIFGQNQSPPSPPGCPCLSDPESELNEFKTCIADVQRENPDLAAGAIHQIALQRYSKKNERKSGRGADRGLRSSVMGDVFSKFRIGKGPPNQSNCPGPHQYMRSSSDTADLLPGRRHSIAPRKSASNLEGSIIMDSDIHSELAALERVDSTDSDYLEHLHSSKSSLEQSLPKMKFDIEPVHNHSNHGRSISHRQSSVPSELADVLEDAELDNSPDNITKEHASQNKFGESLDLTVELNDLQSISAQLDDARAKMGSSTEAENKNDANSPNQNGRQRSCRRRSLKAHLFDSSISRNSFTESESSFRGDFSAWRRSSMLSVKSHRGSVSSSTSSLGDDDGFMAYMGDFSAWRRSKKAMKRNNSEEEKKKEAT